ncbi:Six-hairpin glycosidase-like protein [Astrocystis sublimbata]|nr:Six-hairpin glycosidase-like protein [Astrocystis sublimbata]
MAPKPEASNPSQNGNGNVNEEDGRLCGPTTDGSRYELTSPTLLPKAASFLWNQRMMIQVTCRGYAIAQFMQPEPAKYTHAPCLEARTFMQPEQNYYAHHPGRFVYVKDEDLHCSITEENGNGKGSGSGGGSVFSAPYEPVRGGLDKFLFSAGKSDVRWVVEKLGIRVTMTLTLPVDDVAELWTVTVTNLSTSHNNTPRNISIYPYFPIGYMSWMSQSASYSPSLNGIIARSTTPYQQAAEYFAHKRLRLKDMTYLLCEEEPTAYDARQDAFEGEGGLHAPEGIVMQKELGNSEARYETPTAVVQYRLSLKGGEEKRLRFLLGPAADEGEVRRMREKYLKSPEVAFSSAAEEYAKYIARGAGCITVQSPDAGLDNFVNHWLPRQVNYHGSVNRLTTDPQTRNYLQDALGMCYIAPSVAREALLIALSQQDGTTGAMPDGILLSEEAELKYINTVPHADHCVWLPVAMEAYLAETGDYGVLDVDVVAREKSNGNDGGDDGGSKGQTVFDRISHAIDHLLAQRDPRGLSYILQGDWCDPMNMVGYKGVGVSGWLTLATAYACRLWAAVCASLGHTSLVEKYTAAAAEVNEAAQRHFFKEDWFARGITDDGVTFGVKEDKEGSMWLNPQTFAILSGAVDVSCSDSKSQPGPDLNTILASIDTRLSTPYGVQMFAPPYTAMREDVGRVTQKAPGSAENGSVYNHAAIFYAHALYGIAFASTSTPSSSPQNQNQEQSARAYEVLRRMVPGVPSSSSPASSKSETDQDLIHRGQLPLYIPNYYRGAYAQYPRTAGRSSQLFNTGTASWAYRVFIEGLCGLRGYSGGLLVHPQMPPHWPGMRVSRMFRGARFVVDVQRVEGMERNGGKGGDGQENERIVVKYKGEVLPEGKFAAEDIVKGETYEVFVEVTR